MSELLRLLVVEDNPGDLGLIQEMLPEKGPVNFQVESASRLSAALNRLERGGMDLVLLDLGLPDSQGLQTFRQLRQARPEVPVIVLSGNNEQELAVTAVHEGAQDYFVKGQIKGGMLVRAVRYALERERLSADLRAALAQVRLADEELKRTNQSLAARNAEIQSFYHTLSHELRAPLTAASGFVSIVMDGLPGPLNETQLEYLGIAKESCDQLGSHISDLLDVTRLQTGKMSVVFQTGPLAAPVETVVKMLAPAAAKKGVGLTSECAPGLPDVPFDRQRLVQVLINLTTNAIKFTPAGGQVRLRLSEAPADSASLAVAVSDTGRGIPQDQFGLIFNRLHQVKPEDAPAETRGGLGLGLYICRGLVQLQGGHLGVESELGRGSTFTVTLPKRRSCACPIAKTQPEP